MLICVCIPDTLPLSRRPHCCPQRLKPGTKPCSATWPLSSLENCTRPYKRAGARVGRAKGLAERGDSHVKSSLRLIKYWRDACLKLKILRLLFCSVALALA